MYGGAFGRRFTLHDEDSVAEIIDTIKQWVEQIILTLGYGGIALVMLLENLFPPIPSELVMPFGGFLAAQGQLSVFWVIAAGTVGSVLGAVALYEVGRMFGERRVRAIIDRYGRWLGVDGQDFDRAVHAFERHGQAIVFFGRLIPLIRSLISIPAGVRKMPLPTFLLFTTLGSAAWNTALTYAGMVLGQNWQAVLDVIKRYQQVVIVALVILFVWLAWRGFQKRRTQSALAE